MYVYFSTIYVHVVNNDFSDYIHAYIILKKLICVTTNTKTNEICW